MSTPSAKSLGIIPRLSEKGYGLSHSRVYIVELDPTINKHNAKRAIESQFGVSVIKINVANIKGKAKRTVSKQGRRVAKGRDRAVRKAYVTLAEGNSLPFYEAIEEEEKKSEQVQEKISKEIAKQDKPKRRARKEAKD